MIELMIRWKEKTQPVQAAESQDYLGHYSRSRMQQLVAVCTRAETLHNQTCSHLYIIICILHNLLSQKDLDLCHSQNGALGASHYIHCCNQPDQV